MSELRYELVGTKVLGAHNVHESCTYLIKPQQLALAQLLNSSTCNKRAIMKSLGGVNQYTRFAFSLLPIGGYIVESRDGTRISLTGELDITKLKVRSGYVYNDKLLYALRMADKDVVIDPTYTKAKARNSGKKGLRCRINGVVFESIAEAARALSVSPSTIKKRCNLAKWPCYQLIDNPL